MKKIAAVFLAVLFCALSLPLSAAAKDKTVLRVYNWGEYISNGDDGSLDVIAEFEKRNPDVNVEYTTYATNEEMYAKIASGSADYDVLIPSDYMIGKMISENMLAKLDFSNIPNYSKIDPEFKNLPFDPNNEYSVPYTWGTVGIIYNKKMVTDPVDSWDILWNEKYKGQILMFDNPRDAYGIAMKKLGYSQNTTDQKQIDEATRILEQQKHLVQAYVMDQIFSKMPNGEAALAPYYSGDAITMMKDSPDLGFAIPKEGSNRFVDAMAVPATSQNKALAEKFIDFMLEPDIAKANIEYIGYSSPMTSVRNSLSDDLKNSAIAYPGQDILSKCDTFINLSSETTTYMQQGWTSVMSYGETNVGALVILGIAFAAVVALMIFLLLKKRRDRR